MTKGILSNRFGLIALTWVSLFVSTHAFSITVQAVKDVDAPARKPFQTSLVYVSAPAGTPVSQIVVTVPASQRLVVERVTGYCLNLNSGYVALQSYASGPGTTGFEFLPQEFMSVRTSATSTRLYVNPGEDFRFTMMNDGAYDATCVLTASGYYVNLP
jgi:hypothetical protein